MVIPPSSSATTISAAKGRVSSAAASITSAQTADRPMISMRRSIRSDAQPIGYCRTSPPRYSAPTKIEISRSPSPACVPQTDAIPNMAENTPPVSSMPTQPRGEMRNSSPKPSRRVSSKAGAGVGASRMGMNASDTSTEGTMNSAKPDGSGRFNSTWLAMIPSICTII